ncbi:MAG TPA: hypothetical protein VK154_08280 [Chitinophagales bacterium]|nr:hypothetical protein [Chitinophagales bacterium]
MKTIFTFCACLLFAAGAYAQNTGKATNQSKGMGDKYVPGYSKNACAYTVKAGDGKPVIYQNGQPVSGDVKLAAAKITANGVLKKDGGAERILVPGNCVSEKGTITLTVE